MGINKNHKIEDYINAVCSKIKNPKVHDEVKREVGAHIEEIMDEYIAEGFSVDESAGKAIAHMGDAALIGKELNKVHKENPEWSILALTLIFTSIGILSVFLIKTSGLLVHDWTISFVRIIVSTLVGLVAAVGFYFFDYRKIHRFSKHIYIGSIVFIVINILLGVPVNGRPMLNIGITKISFIDMSPFLFLVALSGLIDKWNWRETKKAIYGTALIIVPPILMYAGNSSFAIIAYSIAIITILYISGIRLKYILLLLGTCVGAAVFYIFREPYRIQAIFIYLHPERNPTGDGYVSIQLNKLIESAGVWGKGINFEPKAVPNISGDFIFTYIVYTFGWIAGIILAVLVIVFLVRIALIPFVIKSNYGKFITSGFVAILVVQFVWNILMNLGLAPIMSIGLPFISYGNSQFVLNMAVIGLISSVYKQRNISEKVHFESSST